VPIVGKGIVRAVQSGDSLVLAKTGGKDSFEETVYLAYITAPRCGNHQRSEEAFAFDAREFVRERLIGKKVDFTIEYMIKERRYVTIACEDSSINLMIVKAGFAKALEKKSNDPKFEAIAAASEDCSKRKVGLWQTDPKFVEKHMRQVTYFGEADYNQTKLLEEANKEPKPLAAILEYVFGTNFVSLFIYKLKTVVKMQLVHLYTPKETE
jgi:staphylococcal nuclease domain-containing protein 1